MNYRTATILAILTAVLMIAGSALAASAAATPSLDRVPQRPDFTAALDPGETVTLPSATCDGRAPSDLHVYTRAGRPLHQRRAITAGGHYWRSRSGRTTAAYVSANRDFFAGCGRVIVAAWCG